MTRPRRNALTEAQVSASIDAYLEMRGYLRKFSQDKSFRRQLSGWPDRVCFTPDFVLLVEIKRPGGRRRHSQVLFAAAIAPFLCDWLRYVCADDVAQVAAVFGDEVI